MSDYRCSLASAADGEPLAGTAPTATELLVVEAPGAWGRDAISENQLPEPVRAHLAALSGPKVLLVRRHGGGGGPGTRVFHARREGAAFHVTAGLLADPHDLLALDVADLAPYDGPLWLVCTNGRRDLCCAEVGREVAGRLAAHWPDATWETTHLGGHRFAATLLALPTGLVLGRLGPDDAVASCRAVEAGGLPLDRCRGRTGSSPEEQVLELHVAAGGSADVAVVAVAGPVRRQSCGDPGTKPTTVFEVRPR